MSQTIKISHFLSKDTLSQLENTQKTINKMIKSDSFISLIETASRINKIAKINIASFYKSQNFKDLHNTINILDENKNNILSAIARINYKTLDHQNNTIQIEQSNNSLTKEGKNFNKEDFIRLDYELTITKKENETLKYEIKALKEENITLLEVQNKYKSEKRKGGKASGKKYEDLRNKVEEICSRLMKEKRLPSALQLTRVVAKELEKSHQNLLKTFSSYIKYKRDGGDWTKPSLERWCRTHFNNHSKTLK